jgi:hypothetical protein
MRLVCRRYVAHAPRRAASTLVSTLAYFLTLEDKHRDESRRGTHECVRHKDM